MITTKRTNDALEFIDESDESDESDDIMTVFPEYVPPRRFEIQIARSIERDT